MSFLDEFAGQLVHRWLIVMCVLASVVRPSVNCAQFATYDVRTKNGGLEWCRKA
jgi:hypothetical protein